MYLPLPNLGEPMLKQFRTRNRSSDLDAKDRK